MTKKRNGFGDMGVLKPELSDFTPALAMAAVIAILFFGIGMLASHTHSPMESMAQQVERLTRENEDLRLAANRRLRASSHFLLPGFTAEALARCTNTAEDYGLAWGPVAAVAKNENGGDMLECGIQHIDADVLQHYPARDQQFAQLCKMISREQTRLVMGNPELQAELLTKLAKRYNSTHWRKWVISVQSLMEDFRDELPALPAKPAPLRAKIRRVKQ